jgi:Fuc2NAc and GlcNAc transferase
MSLILVPSNPLLFLIACIGGFLIWNWQKAKIFMGDAGSTFLGFNFAVFGLYFQNEYAIPFILWLLICGVAIFDTTYTLIRRIIYKENIFLPHKNQIFHRLVLSGFSHQQVVFIQQGLNVVICLGVWYALHNRTAIVPVMIGIALLFGGYAFWAEKRFPFDKVKKKKQ